ncbi:AprI/Inh family metalloprotease inhibitor [uncultured Brevundimonas sp.]|uniref:AprI/Inh family metalloprotease inhibitor n=1 Tax=uncultured Brevundimonas sp. TaxID=213418 RepID=UPI0030ED19AD|tara:strand:- start:362 stop:775 length:414 start_codon:yes stop_codon:yes gene_type:complete
MISLPMPVAAALLSLAIAVPAGACQSREAAMPKSSQVVGVEDVIGYWRIQPVDGDATGDCLIALQRRPLGDGHGIHLERCDLKATAGAVRWREVTGGFALVDAAGAVLMRFSQDTVDQWTGTDPSGHRYRLSRAAEN